MEGNGGQALDLLYGIRLGRVWWESYLIIDFQPYLISIFVTGILRLQYYQPYSTCTVLTYRLDEIATVCKLYFVVVHYVFSIEFIRQQMDRNSESTSYQESRATRKNFEISEIKSSFIFLRSLFLRPRILNPDSICVSSSSTIYIDKKEKDNTKR